MATAYTPGLKVTESAVIDKERRLPLCGEVLVKKGDKVNYDTIVARTFLPGEVHPLNGAGILGLEPQELPQAMLKKEGDRVAKDELIAQSKGMFGLFKSSLLSPIDGSIEIVSQVTGQVMLREAPVPVEIPAYLNGTVEEIIPGEGVIIKSFGVFIQGIFGIGGETNGELLVIASPEEEIIPQMLKPEHREKILAGGSLVTYAALEQAVKIGIKGLVTGGIGDKDLRDFLGYDLGVAITGAEKKGITLVFTEGFGKMQMAEKTWRLLKAHEGKTASLNGATQIRAGVMRPEIVITREFDESGAAPDFQPPILELGNLIRIIREPNFGVLAKVRELPVEPVSLPTEARVRVLVVETEKGELLTLPRANVELIESEAPILGAPLQVAE